MILLQTDSVSAVSQKTLSTDNLSKEFLKCVTKMSADNFFKIAFCLWKMWMTHNFFFLQIYKNEDEKLTVKSYCKA